MPWTPPPEPHLHVPDVAPGTIITRDHPAWHRREDPEVWGALDGAGHNPFHDALREPEDHWGSEYWKALVDSRPHVHAVAQAALEREVPRLHLAMSVPSVALEHIATEGRVRSAFDLHDFAGQHWSRLGQEYLPIRATSEHAHFGYPDDHRWRGSRPVYGFLTHDLHGDASASAFGEHTLVLSKPRLAHRTTFTGADSLDAIDDARAAAYTEPKLYALPQHFSFHRGHFDHGVGDALNNPGRSRSNAVPYVEAQYHGGVTSRDIHYAILRTPHPMASQKARKANERLGEHLSAAGIPWVRLDARRGRGEPVSWDAGDSRHEGVLMAVHRAVTSGAFNADHFSQVHWHQGDYRYLIELVAEDGAGHRMGQIADTEWGALYPPMPMAAILTRDGYWESLDYPVEAEDVLARVRPVG